MISPGPVFPEITLPAPGAVPPIVLLPESLTAIPARSLGRAIEPVASTPM